MPGWQREETKPLCQICTTSSSKYEVYGDISTQMRCASAILSVYAMMVTFVTIYFQDGAGLNGGEGNVPVVVGRPVPAPSVVAMGTSTTPPVLPSVAVATPRPSSYDAPVMPSTGVWAVPGCGSTDSGGGGGGRIARSLSSSSGAGGGGYGGTSGGVYSTPSLTHTGIHIVPGCGTSSGTGGRRFGEGRGAASGDAGRFGGSGSSTKEGGMAMRGAYGGLLALGDGDYVGDGGPVLVACGYGRSMYDVQGCLSSWVLVGEGRQEGKTNPKLGAFGGPAAKGGGDAGEEDGTRFPVLGPPAWALRSEATPAGDGGVMCSACIPSVESGQRMLPRMLVTGGKDMLLREWEVADGRPRLVAEIPG